MKISPHGCGSAEKENATRIEERVHVKFALISSQLKPRWAGKKKTTISLKGELKNVCFCGRS